MKKYITLWFVFVTVIISFTSCLKENQSLTIVKGAVKDTITGEPIANMPVNILECDLGFYLGSNPCHSFQTVITDLNGNYKYSFKSGKGSFYKVALGGNDHYSASEYPIEIESKKENTINFSENPIKILELRVKVLRPDKKYLIVSASNVFNDNSYSTVFYNGVNPPGGLDTTCYTRIKAGRSYALFVQLANEIVNNSYKDPEIISKRIEIENVDTTRIDFIVK